MEAGKLPSVLRRQTHDQGHIFQLSDAAHSQAASNRAEWRDSARMSCSFYFSFAHMRKPRPVTTEPAFFCFFLIVLMRRLFAGIHSYFSGCYCSTFMHQTVSIYIIRLYFFPPSSQICVLMSELLLNPPPVLYLLHNKSLPYSVLSPAFFMKHFHSLLICIFFF